VKANKVETEMYQNTSCGNQ